MNIELWKLIASIGALLVTTVTGPLIWAVRAESGKIRAAIRGWSIDEHLAGTPHSNG